MKILLAEPEHDTVRMLTQLLEHQRYVVDCVGSGTELFDWLSAAEPDCIILSMALANPDGLEILRTLRERGISVPVLMLSAKAAISDRVIGLDTGADDYMAVPFAASEFLARVRALLRRSRNYQSSVLSFGNVTLDCPACTLRVGEKSVQLSRKEFQLLECFMRNPTAVQSTESLMDRIWGWDTSAEVNVVWTNIGYLRKKFREMGANIELKSLRGLGYCLRSIEQPA